MTGGSCVTCMGTSPEVRLLPSPNLKDSGTISKRWFSGCENTFLGLNVTLTNLTIKQSKRLISF